MSKKNLYLTLVACCTSLILEGVVNPALAVEKTTSQPLTYPENSIAQAKTRTYKIKLGDTLSGIAYKNGVTVQQILSFNANLRKNPNLIQVGQVIYLSKPTQSATKPKPPSTVARRQSVQTFNLPNQRRMANSRVGARRGDPKQECRSNVNDALRVLLPETNFGYTLQDYPTFFWYMPELKTKAERFELKIRPVGADRFETYKFTSNNQNSGVMSIALPADMKPLEEGKEYQWEIRVYCTPQMFISASGNIERVSTNNPSLATKLENAAVDDYPAILAQEGIWYDSLATLAGLREEKPTDQSLNNDWTSILKMIGFENIANAPLLVSEGTPNN